LHNIGGTAYMFDEVTCRGSSVEMIDGVIYWFPIYLPQNK
jgi:hypothetical protein